MVNSVPSEMVLFIAATLATAGAAGTFVWTTGDLVDEYSIRGELHADRTATAIQIVNDPGDVPTSPLLVYVKNIGATVLDENMTALTVDGRYVNPDQVRLLAGATAWGPGDVVRYRVPDSEASLDAGDHTVRVVTENGRSDELRFRV